MDQLIALLVTIVSSVITLQQLGPLLAGAWNWIKIQNMLLGHACRHSGVVWLVEKSRIYEITAAIGVAGTVYVFYEYWYWAVHVPEIYIGLVIAWAMWMSQAYLRDRLVQAQGGPDDRHVLFTLRTTLGGLFMQAWIWGWVGCDLHKGILAEHPHQMGIQGIALFEAQTVGVMSLAVIVLFVSVAAYLLHICAVILIALMPLATALRSNRTIVFANLDLDRTIDEFKAWGRATFGDEWGLTTPEALNRNFYRPIASILAFILFDRVTMLVWMDASHSLYLAGWWVVGEALHLGLVLMTRDGMKRLTAPHWATLLPFILPVGATAIFLITGPDRGMLQVPEIYAVYMACKLLMNLPWVTTIVFLPLLVGFCAGLGYGIKWGLSHLTEIPNKWVKGGLIAVPSTVIFLIGLGKLIDAAHWSGDVLHGDVPTNRFSLERAWDHGLSGALLLIPIVALAGFFYKKMDGNVKTLAGVGTGVFATAFAIIVFVAFGAGFTRPAYASTTPTYEVPTSSLPVPPGYSTNDHPAAITGYGTCNNTSQCRRGLRCDDGMCVPPR